MQVERGLGQSLPQDPPGPGWAGKWPKIDDFRSYPPPKNKKLKTLLTALEHSIPDPHKAQDGRKQWRWTP